MPKSASKRGRKSILDKREKISITISEEVLKKVETMAREEGRPLSNMISWILEQYFNK